MLDKITLYIPSFNGGGAEKTIIFLSNALADKGYNVDLITLNSNGVYRSYVQRNVNVIDFKKSRVLKSIPLLIKYFRKEKPSTFISAMTHVNLASIIAKKLSNVDCNLIISIHSITSRSIKSKFSNIKMKIITKYFYPHAQHIVCISKAVAEDLIGNFNIDKNNLYIIHNPVIYPDIYMKSNEKINIKRKKGEKLVISVGRLESVKNFPVLIKAIKNIKEKGFNIKLLILGEGSQRWMLENLIKELDIKDYVSMPGFMNNIYPYYKKADLFVLPSKTEGFGNVLIEAMAFNLPVIAAKNSGGPDEILDYGKLGQLFDNDNYMDLALKIEEILRSDKGEFRKYDIKKYQIDEVASKYIELIKRHRK